MSQVKKKIRKPIFTAKKQRDNIEKHYKELIACYQADEEYYLKRIEHLEMLLKKGGIQASAHLIEPYVKERVAILNKRADEYFTQVLRLSYQVRKLGGNPDEMK